MDPLQMFLIVTMSVVVFFLGCFSVTRINKLRRTAHIPDAKAFSDMLKGCQRPIEVAQKYWDAARSHVTHEDSLVNQRMTWNIVVQVGLTAAMFQTYRQEKSSESLIQLVPTIRSTIVILGTLFCLVSALGVLAAHLNVSRVKSMWIRIADMIRNDHPGFASFQISGEGLPGWIGFATHYALLILVVASWWIFYAQIV